MNPSLFRSLAMTALLATVSGSAAQTQLPATTGGGTLQVGKESYKFTIESLNLAPAQPKLKLPRAFVLRGKLVPPEGPSLAFELTALEDGRIYGLRLVRKRPDASEGERWSATLKTKVDVLELDARPAGKLRISLSGPLAGSEGDKSGPTLWKGELWGTFRDVPL